MRHLPPLAILLLTGCVNMSGLDGASQYACEAPQGVACDSVSGTYANAVRHNLPSQRAARASQTSAPAAGHARSETPDRQVSASEAQEQAEPAPPGAGTQRADWPGTALRSPARVLRLWIKPWEDADGDLWDQGHVYVQVDNGSWRLDHVRQTTADRQAPLRPPPSTQPGAPLDDRPAPSEQLMPSGSAPSSGNGGLPASPFGQFPSTPTLPPSPPTPSPRQR